jgi:sugar transferase (PEP-CTERM system associated)
MAPLRIFGHYVSRQSALLLILDAAIVVVSFFLGDWMRVVGASGLWMGHAPLLPKVTVFLVVALLMFSLAGLYEKDSDPHFYRIVLRVAAAASMWGMVYSAIAFAIPTLRLGRFAVLTGIALGSLGILLVRQFQMIHSMTGRFRDNRLLFLGATPVAARLISAIHSENPGYTILGYVDDRDPRDAPPAITNGFRILGKSEELQEIAAATGANIIVVALAERRGTFPMQAILDCKLQGIRVEDWPAFYEKLTGKIVVQDLRPSWLVFSDGFERTRVTRMVKRWIDVALSVAILAVGWPIFLLVSIAIRLDSRGPTFFRQDRVGEQGKSFTLYKFRTMKENAEQDTGPVWATINDVRITPVGRWLRKSRLDEFPQVINVLRGEMSFIGPRPERPHFVAQLQERIPYYAQRHTVKPGITGWAQVRYPYGATVDDAEEKLQYDLYYIKNMSFFLDMLILLLSMHVILFGRGAR